MAPVLDKLQISNLEELTVLKMNVDKNMGFAQELNIMDIPTILVLKDGNIVDTIVGQMPYEELAAKVATHTL
jgi:thioredoxin 1